MKCYKCRSQLHPGDTSCSECGDARLVLEPSFARAEGSYVQLRHQYDSGSLSADQFKAAVEAQAINHDGRYWMLGVNSGEWYVHDGTAWREEDPPVSSNAAPPLSKRTSTPSPPVQSRAPITAAEVTRRSSAAPAGMASYLLYAYLVATVALGAYALSIGAPPSLPITAMVGSTLCAFAAFKLRDLLTSGTLSQNLQTTGMAVVAFAVGIVLAHRAHYWVVIQGHPLRGLTWCVIGIVVGLLSTPQRPEAT